MNTERINVQARFQITIQKGGALNGEFMKYIGKQLDDVLNEHGWTGDHDAVVTNMWRGEFPGGQIVPESFVVSIMWPADADRGIETYGPFDSPVEQERFVSQCQTAADEGWELLAGAEYLIHRVAKPFNPTALWEKSSDALNTESKVWIVAKQYHYDRHSRHFPIEECNVAECKSAVRRHG